jgi:hypothetical protein
MSLNIGITLESVAKYLERNMDNYIQTLIYETQHGGMKIIAKEGQMIKPQVGEVNGR